VAADEIRGPVLERLLGAIDRPLTSAGSQVLAHAVLDRFEDSRSDLLARFSDKVIETLADGVRHDALAVDPARTVAIWFVVWPGSHREVQAARIGEYLGEFAGILRRVVEAGAPVQCLLEIDVYVVDADKPPGAGKPDLEVEYSFAPAVFFGGAEPSEPQWMTVMLNPGLLSSDEYEAVQGFIT